MTLSGKAFHSSLVFCHSLAKLLPKVSVPCLSIRVHCSYSRCPMVHGMINSEKLAVIQGWMLTVICQGLRLNKYSSYCPNGLKKIPFVIYKRRKEESMIEFYLHVLF